MCWRRAPRGSERGWQRWARRARPRSPPHLPGPGAAAAPARTRGSGSAGCCQKPPLPQGGTPPQGRGHCQGSATAVSSRSSGTRVPVPGAARTPAQALSAVPCACCPPNVPVTMETSPSQRRRSLRPLVQDNALFFLRSGSPALPGPAANAGARGDWGVPGSPGMAWWIQSWIQCQEGLCGVSWGEWLPCWSQGIPVQAPGE